MEGLNLSLMMKVMGYRCRTLLDAVDLAAWFEDEYKKYLESQPKGKGKMFALRPSTSEVPSSGRKRKASTITHGRRSFA